MGRVVSPSLPSIQEVQAGHFLAFLATFDKQKGHLTDEAFKVFRWKLCDTKERGVRISVERGSEIVSYTFYYPVQSKPNQKEVDDGLNEITIVESDCTIISCLMKGIISSIGS
jgi:hypothetical protein